MVFIGLRSGALPSLIWPAGHQKNPMIFPTGMYLAQHGFYGVVYQSKMARFKTLSGPTWILWLSIPILHGPLLRLTWPAKNPKNPMIFPTGMYLAQHGFYGVVYQSKRDPFPSPSGPTWILWLSVPIRHGPLSSSIWP